MAGNQQSSSYYRQFSPTEQHNPLYQPGPSAQNHASYHPAANGHPAALPAQPYAPSSRAYYDPVTNTAPEMNPVGWSYSSRERERERTGSVHSLNSAHSQAARDPRYNYGDVPPRSPVELHAKAGYPLPSPTVDRPPSLRTTDQRASVAPSDYSRRYSQADSASPTVSTYQQASATRMDPDSRANSQQPRRQGGAMSIMNLLSNTSEQAASAEPPVPKLAHPKAAPESSRQPPRSQVERKYVAPPAASNHYDADATDSDSEEVRSLMVPNGSKGPSASAYYKAPVIDNDVDMERTDSDDSVGAFEEEREQYMMRIRKRQFELEEVEAQRRKRRRVLFQESLHKSLASYGQQGRNRARQKFYSSAIDTVMAKEDADERERKKEQQRKRRREKAEIDRKIKAENAAARAMQEEAAQPRSYPEQAVKLVFKNKTHPPVMSEDDGMDMQDSDFSSMPMDDEGKKTRKKPGPKKKAAAISPEAEEFVRPEPVKEEPYVPHVSKQYNQMYDQIWKDIARKEIPKVYRVQQNSLNVKQANLRKTAQLASKEAQRWKLRTTKNIKDTQARAKRCMREMLTFWKQNEREEREMRRRAEKEAVDRAKREEEKREAQRQAKKLNFLISQTELYSHFIGRKIKTDDIEKSTGSDAVAAASDTGPGLDLPDMPDNGGQGHVVTDFESLDFDDDDALKRAAMNNAQHAIASAKAKAQAFNNPNGENANGDLSNLNLDDGEMNFQNPTSFGDVEIEQPKLLNCQLKEYQLKGLNWLVNLYEQGINGILADEMGLGKTVQSISVMAYLAEHHNIWGPFLVVAPASTLHNWQQEIARFVPAFKVVPYWGSTKDRKILRKFWDRKSVTYDKDSPFHVLITSYQLVVQDAQYFQRMKWQYMILDEAQAIKSSSSSRWKALLAFHCRNRLLLTGTPIQNSMQELWALLHFIMPSLFDSHDEFSEWFSKDIESHAQSNTQLNEAQLRRLHMILKPFMLRRVKKHVQKELGDKVEIDVFCNLTYRQRQIYQNLREKISLIDLVEKAALGGDEDRATLMNLVMQFRKVCNHPDLFERADIKSPLALTAFGETPSFLREGSLIQVPYTARSLITYQVPSLVYREGGRLDLAGSDSEYGSRYHILRKECDIWKPNHIQQSMANDPNTAFGWARLVDYSVYDISTSATKDFLDRVDLIRPNCLGRFAVAYDEEEKWTPARSMLIIDPLECKRAQSEASDGVMAELLNVSKNALTENRLHTLAPMYHHKVSGFPITLECFNQGAVIEQQTTLFNERIRHRLFAPNKVDEEHMLEYKVSPWALSRPGNLPQNIMKASNISSIEIPSMSRFVSDSGKLAKLDALLTQLKREGHRVLLYFQMTKMMDLCEEYLTYRHHKYLRLDGSSKLEDRRDMVSAWQTDPSIFVFILSTRAGGLGINLTAADTVIFYDSDWNPTIDSQAMDRAHRLGQTKQVTVYRLITRNTIEERIRMRAQQKEEVQRVVIQGGDPAKKNVDFKGTREVATWLFEDGEAEEVEKRIAEKEKAAEEAKAKGGKPAKGGRKKKDTGAGAAKSFNIEDMYHEGEGRFDESSKPSEASTPAAAPSTTAAGKKKGRGKGANKKKTTQERLNMIDGTMDVKMGGV